MIVTLLSLSAGMGVAACGGGSQPPSETPTLPPPNVVIIPGTTQTPVPTNSINTPQAPTLIILVSYDPELAIKYAISWAKEINPDFGEYPGTDCANFVSQAILAGFNGVFPDGEWRPGSLAWIGTPALFKFLSERFSKSEFTNDKYSDGYYPLRRYPKWEEEFLPNTPILPGDIVFYWDESMANKIDANIYPPIIYPDRYTHTAIVVDINMSETSYANSVLVPADTTILKPRVVDHSGPTGSQLPRSIDDTANTMLKKVAIIHMTKPK